MKFKDFNNATPLSEYTKLDDEYISSDKQEEILRRMFNYNPYENTEIDEDKKPKSNRKDNEKEHKGEKVKSLANKVGDKAKGLAKTTGEKAKNFAMKRGVEVKNYINKSINFSGDDQTKETFLRKAFRTSITAICTIGPLFLPVGFVTKSILAFTGFIIGKKISEKKLKDTYNLYDIKLKQVREKIEETDDEKEKFNLRKVESELVEGMKKVKREMYKKSTGTFSNKKFNDED